MVAVGIAEDMARGGAFRKTAYLMIEHASTASCHVPTPIDPDKEKEKESGITQSAAVPPSILADDLRSNFWKL